jgi:FkbM family methyltransferase
MTDSFVSKKHKKSLLEEVRLLDRHPDWRRDLPDPRAKDLAQRLDNLQKNFALDELLETKAILGKLYVDPILTLEPLCALALTSKERRNWALAEIIRISNSWSLIEERVPTALRVNLRTKAREFLRNLLKELPKNRDLIRFFASLLAKNSGTMEAIAFLEECLASQAPVEDIFLYFIVQALEISQNSELLAYALQNFNHLRAGAGFYWYVFDFHRAVILSSILEIEPEPAILQIVPRSSLLPFSNFRTALDLSLQQLHLLPIHIGIDLLRGLGAIRLFWHSRIQGAEFSRKFIISQILQFLDQNLSSGQRTAILWILNSCLDRTEDFWKNLTFRHTVSGKIVEISRSLPDPEKFFFTGRYSFILEDYDTTRECFARYAIAKPEAHFFGSYIDHRDVRNLISHLNVQSLPSPDLNFIRDSGETSGPSLITSANLDYFFRYAKTYMESLEKFGSDFHLHFHVYGCHAKARAYLDKIAEKSELKRLSISSEEISMSAPYYFATARFSYLSNWSKTFKAPLIVTDIDLQWRVHPRKFLGSRMKDGDVGLALNHSVRPQRSSWPASSKNRYPELLSNAVRAWAVALRGNDASEKFAEIFSALTHVELAKARSRSPSSNWYIDQAILAACYAYCVRAFPNIKFSDLRDIPHDEESLTESDTLDGPPHHWLGSPSSNELNLANKPAQPREGAEMASSSDPTNSYQNDVLEWSRKISARLDELTTLQHFALLGPDKIHDFLCRDEKIRMYLPYAATDLIQRHILRTGVFFEMMLLEKFRRHIPIDATIIDAGANIGNHSVYFSKICYARSVYAFEPMRQTFKILARNAELNAPERIKCYNYALGASDTKAALLQFYPGNIGTARVQSSTKGLYEIKPLDAFHFPEVQVLKIDVEGAEIDVLEGARQTLARCKPIIWVELLPNYAPKSDAMLRSLGYEQIEVLSPTDFVYRAQGS